MNDREQSQWTVIVQLQVFKTVKIGKLPSKPAAEVNYYVERPDAFAPEWMIGFNMTPVVANFFAKLLGLSD